MGILRKVATLTDMLISWNEGDMDVFKLLDVINDEQDTLIEKLKNTSTETQILQRNDEFKHIEETKPQYLIIHMDVKGYAKDSAAQLNRYAKKVCTLCNWQRAHHKTISLYGSILN